MLIFVKYVNHQPKVTKLAILPPTPSGLPGGGQVVKTTN